MGNTCMLGGPQQGDKMRTPLPSPVPTKGPNCWVTRAFSGFPNKGTKLEMATSPLSSRGPKRGRNCYVTHAFSWPPNKGGKIRSGYLILACSWADKREELLRQPCILGTPRQREQN